MTTLTYTDTEGERRKLNAFAVLEAHRETLINRGRRALLRHLLDNDTATADDVRAAVILPAGVNPKAFGSVPGELADAGIIAADGFAKSRRPEAHARPVQIWRLIDRDAALTWLGDHPDMPDPAPPTPPDAQGELFGEGRAAP